jgi:two-component system response regulator AtoC
LSRLRYECVTETDPLRAVDVIERERPWLVLTDLRMPHLDGIGVLRAAKQVDPEVRVVLLTAYASVQTAVSSMRDGAFDYLTKPFTGSDLEQVVRRAVSYANRERGTEATAAGASPVGPASRETRAATEQLPPIIGDSRPMRQVLELVKKVAITQSNVLICGESGTGKELIARAIHSQSPRASRPFVPVDCVSLPDTLLESELFGHERGAFTGAHSAKPGLFEIANGGTVFLDEVSGMSPNLQSRLLRVLQERQIRPVGGTRFVDLDVRVIAASNKDLEPACRRGEFREDLFYRLNVIQLVLPPLRVRFGDIPLLAFEFIRRFARLNGIPVERIPTLDEPALEMLTRYQWPGNVRELQNVIERAMVLAEGQVITSHHLPERLRLSMPLGTAPDDPGSFKQAKQRFIHSFERTFLLDLLKRNGGHMGRAAREAGVDRKTIERMVKKHGLRGMF